MSSVAVSLGIRNAETNAVEVTEGAGGDFDLFGGVIDDALPEVPAELKQYDTEVNNRIAAQEGELVFMTWLFARMTNSSQYIPEDSQTQTRCSDGTVENIDIFWPEFPDEDEYPGGEDSMAYKRDFILADINMMMAKRECAKCPFRVQCLTKALDTKDYSDAVWGGWGPGARGKIDGQFQNLRRSYERGRKSMEEGLLVKDRNGKLVLSDEGHPMPTSEYKGMHPATIIGFESSVQDRIIAEVATRKAAKIGLAA